MRTTYEKISMLWNAMTFQTVYRFDTPFYDWEEDAISMRCSGKPHLAKLFRGLPVFNKAQIYMRMKHDEKFRIKRGA